jgi:hypothetical protein
MDNRFVYMIEWNISVAISALIILLLSTLILRTILSWPVAGFVSFVKVTLSIVYFCFFADGQWFYGGDDYKYYEIGIDLYRTGANPIMVLFDPVAQWHLFRGQSNTALMGYFNYLAMYFFEPRYYAPVLCLVGISSATAVLLTKAVGAMSSQQYQRSLTIFLALHWHTLAWTSFLNLKDSLVAFVAVGSIFVITRLRMRPVLYIPLYILALSTFNWLRFYFPVFLIPPLVMTKILIDSWKTRLVLSVGGVFCAVIFLQDELRMAWGLGDIRTVMYGAIHFLLQPVPWRLTEPATYLLIPAALHWLMMPIAFFGGWCLFRKSTEGKVIVLIFFLGVLFYALFPLIASTRHRMPFDFLIAAMQFHGIWVLGKLVLEKPPNVMKAGSLPQNN